MTEPKLGYKNENDNPNKANRWSLRWLKENFVYNVFRHWRRNDFELPLAYTFCAWWLVLSFSWIYSWTFLSTFGVGVLLVLTPVVVLAIATNDEWRKFNRYNDNKHSFG